MQNNPLTVPIVYPDSDGMPMADNTRQAEWIVVLYDNLRALFANRPDVFVAANNLWYPVHGRPDIRVAPDVYLAFGRPKGHRGSYRQWEEDDIPLTVAIEVLSPGNSDWEMANKLAFYDEHGVEEYYVYDPDRNHLQVYLRRGTVLLRVRKLEEYVSPRMGIRFELLEDDLRIYDPDGGPFRTFEEIVAERNEANQRAATMSRRMGEERQRADEERQRADQAQQRADQERQRAAEERQRADQAQQRADEERQRAAEERQRADQALQHAAEERQRADQALQRADQALQRVDEERQRAEQLAARLRELGIDPDA